MVELVGRGNELGAIGVHLDRCRVAGRPGLVAIVGEPGSGKSTLLKAIPSGLRRVEASGYLPERNIPLAAVAPVLNRLEPESGQLGLAELLDTPSPLLALFEAAHRSVRRRPTLLLVDDVQWVDERSCALLHYLLRGAVTDGSVLAVVAASRPDSCGVAFLDSLAALVPADAHVRLPLGPLAPTDAAALAHRVRPDLTATEAARLADEARGSPYWILSLARDEDRGLDARLDGLTSDAGELLAALVVAARPVDTELLENVTGWPPPRLTGAADELVAAGLAIRHRSEIATAHDLIREEFARTLPASRAQRLHLGFAEALAGMARSGVGELLLALLHRRAGGADARALAKRILADPRRTLVGVEGLEQLVVELRDEPAHVQIQVAELATALGDHLVAQEQFLVAADRETDAASRAAATLRAAHAAHLRSDWDGALGLLRRARSADTSTATTVAADVLEASVSRWLLHDHPRARALTVRALEAIPDDTTSGWWRQVRLEALNGAHDDALIADDVPEVVRIAELRAELAVGLDERLETASAVMNAFLASGRLSESLEAAGQLLEQSRGAGRPVVMLAATSVLSRSLWELGRVREAETAAAEAVALERRMGPRPGARRAGTLALGLAVSTSDWQQAIVALAANEQDEGDPHFRLSSLQLQLLALSTFGDPDEADVGTLVARGREYAESAGCPRCGAELDAHVTEAWLRTGNHDRAASTWREARRALRDPWLEYHARRVEALLADAEGDRDGSEDLLRLAAEADALSWGRTAVGTRLDLGRSLVARGDHRAGEVLATARDQAAGGGARNEAALADQWLRSLGARTWRRGSAAVAELAAPLMALTGRELAVARHVAGGASNPEIAASLFLSRKTIERHVSSVFVKLGVRNRAALAAYMRELEPR